MSALLHRFIGVCFFKDRFSESEWRELVNTIEEKEEEISRKFRIVCGVPPSEASWIAFALTSDFFEYNNPFGGYQSCSSSGELPKNQAMIVSGENYVFTPKKKFNSLREIIGENFELGIGSQYEVIYLV